jgi:hypothetical protein
MPGNYAETLREAVASMTPAQRAKYAEEMTNLIKSNPAAWSDFSKKRVIESIFTQGAMTGLNNDDLATQKLLDNSFYLLDLLPYAAAMKMMTRPLTSAATSTVQLVNASNKDVSASLISGILKEAQNNPKLRQWNIGKEEIAITQLPKVGVFGESVEDIPNIVIKEIERQDALMAGVSKNIAATRTAYLTDAEKVAVVATELENLKVGLNGIQPRIDLSRIDFWTDGNGFSIHYMYGLSDKEGFKTLRDALETARNYDPSLVSVTVHSSDGQIIKPMAESASELYKQVIENNVEGNFFVSVKHEVPFRPIDKVLFENGIFVGPRSMGTAGQWAMTPNALLDPKFFNKLEGIYRSEQSIKSDIEAMFAEVRRNGILPSSKLPTNRFESITSKVLFKEQQNVNKLLKFAEQFGKVNGRVPNLGEIRLEFPNITDKELALYSGQRRAADNLYVIENKVIRADLLRNGAKTYKHSNGMASYHGVPVDRRNSRSIVGLDATTNQEVILKGKEIEKFYNAGGQVLELRHEVQVGDRFYKTILTNPNNKDWILKELDDFVIPYIPGYYPRMYLDSHFVDVYKTVTVDGIAKEMRFTVGTATTPKKAAEAARRLQTTAKKGERYVARSADNRLEEGDYVTSALDEMRSENRLFYDFRNNQTLKNLTTGLEADIQSPINALSRSAAILARGVTMEDTVQAMKNAFDKSYSDLLGGRTVVGRPVSEVRELLRKQINNNPRALDAYSVWNHIMLAEGVTGASMPAVRKVLIRSAEFVDDLLGGGTGWLSKFTKEAVRSAHKWNPIDIAKSLVYIRYIAGRPVRQRILQTLQHLNLAGLDPTYLGKWQMDTIAFNSLVNDYVVARSLGKEVGDTYIAASAKVMGVSKKELKVMLEQFNMGGHRATVDTRAFAGDARFLEEIPDTRIGRTLESIKGAITLRPIRNAAEQAGFIQGEYFNQSASFMMAIRKYRAKNPVKDLTEYSQRDWDEINAMTNNYSGAMNRMNSAKYQYGIVSLFTQFLQFQHKNLMIWSRALIGKGNMNFTRAEATSYFFNQLLLYGANGLGIRGMWRQILFENDLGDISDNEVVLDMLEGGALDVIIEGSLRKLAEDPELDLNITEPLSPAYAFDSALENFGKVIIEWNLKDQPLGPFGPIGATQSTWANVFRSIEPLFSPKWQGFDGYTKAQIIADYVLAGAFGGWDDAFKARLMSKFDHYLAASGSPINLQVKRAEIYAQLFGIQSNRLDDFYTIQREITDSPRSKRSKEESIAATLKAAMDYDTKMMIQYNKEKTTVSDIQGPKGMARRAMTTSIVMDLVDESDIDIVNKVAGNLIGNYIDSMGDFEPLEIKVANAVVGDRVVGKVDRLINWVSYTKAIPENRKPALIELIKRHMDDEINFNNYLKQSRETDAENMMRAYGNTNTEN